jgi:hypothetical protein
MGHKDKVFHLSQAVDIGTQLCDPNSKYSFMQVYKIVSTVQVIWCVSSLPFAEGWPKF